MLAAARRSISHLAGLISSVPRQSIIVMQGAGVSVSAGIPDFRTPVTGFYSRLEALGLPYPEAIFDIGLFRTDPSAFYAVAHELLPGKFRPTPAHYFAALLAQKGKLMRVYTQNIDGLEKLAGLDESLLVEAHGHFRSAHCASCGYETDIGLVVKSVAVQRPVRCPCGGFVKPDIVFFGESLPARYFDLSEEDFPKARLLIVLGTSLQVMPFASLVESIRPGVPRCLINREPAGTFATSDPKSKDRLLQGDCDKIVADVVAALKWTKEFEALTKPNKK
jgi:NAD-dependent SIR2 family protein deacetylase